MRGGWEREVGSLRKEGGGGGVGWITKISLGYSSC